MNVRKFYLWSIIFSRYVKYKRSRFLFNVYKLWKKFQ